MSNILESMRLTEMSNTTLERYFKYDFSKLKIIVKKLHRKTIERPKAMI